MPKVFSATQFFNELDLLELRLETLDLVVDCFIISESTKTHSGLDKPLYYLENKERYKKFHHKIVHHIIRDTPDSYDEILRRKSRPGYPLDHMILDSIVGADWFNKEFPSYIRDTYEKEALFYPLFGVCGRNDIVLLGDLDEIPRPSKVSLLRDCVSFLEKDVWFFQHDMFYYYLNLQKTNEDWVGTLASTFGNLFGKSYCRLRTEKKWSGHSLWGVAFHVSRGNRQN